MISGSIVAFGGSRAGVLGLFLPNLMPRASEAAPKRLPRFLSELAGRATPPADEGRGIMDGARAAWAAVPKPVAARVK